MAIIGKIGKRKYGGRVKGTPNRRTEELKQVLETLKVNPVKALVELLPQLETDKQADVYLKLIEYIHPKLKAIEISGELDTDPNSESPEVVKALADINEALTEITERKK